MATTYRFDEFRLVAETSELFRGHEKIHLQPQPLQILQILLARPGELVTRSELAEAIWGGSTFTDFDQGLNIAVKKLRDALGDSADEPRFIETLPRRGYRFIGTLTAGSESKPTPPQRRRSLVLASALLSVAFVALGFTAWRYQVGRSRVDFKARDVVLVAQFENQTGESSLDGVLETALEAELTATPYIAVASPERVNDALKLMRQPQSTRAPRALARQICQWDPGIRLALTGAIRKVGRGYLLVAEIIRPESNREAITLTQPAADQAAVLPALKSIAVSVRERLGESLSARNESGGSADPVTTGSLQALKLYIDAQSLGKAGKWAAAEDSLRQAVELDPDFASAYILLAWSVRNQTRADSEFLPIAERALGLAGTTTEREAYFIRGSYHDLRREDDKAIPIYEAMFERYPDHPWAPRNLWVLYSRTHQPQKRRALEQAFRTRRPNDPFGHWQEAWDCLCPPGVDRRRALEVADKALALTRQQGVSASREASAQIQWHMARFVAAWQEADVSRAKADVDQAADVSARAGGGDLLGIAMAYLALGQLRRAGDSLQAVPSNDQLPYHRLRWSLWRPLLAGGRSAPATLLAEHRESVPNPDYIIAILRSGTVRAGEKAFARLGPPPGGLQYYPQAKDVAAGEAAFQRGRFQEAIRLISASLPALEESGYAELWLGAQTLARSHAAIGSTEEAIQVLERVSKLPAACRLGELPFYPLVRHELMLLYRRAGRTLEADEIQKELANLMSVADPDHILKLAIEKGQYPMPSLVGSPLPSSVRRHGVTNPQGL